ncbi:MAG: hypothetical protein ACYDBI_05875 [Thermoplasmataceae archaeon]
MTLHEQEINIGDEVFDLKYGEGKVGSLGETRIYCYFGDHTCSYDAEGKSDSTSQPTLHWPGATVIPGKKKVKTKVWDWVVYPAISTELRQPILVGMSEDKVKTFMLQEGYAHARKVEGTEREVNA